MTIQDALAGLGKWLNMNGLHTDENGVLTLSFDGRPVQMAFDTKRNRVTFGADIGNIPEKGAEFFFRRMLDANRLLAEDCGASLAINDNEGFCCICQGIALDALAADGFVDALEHFVNLNESWCEMLKEFVEIGSAFEEDEKDGAGADGGADAKTGVGTNDFESGGMPYMMA